MYVFVQTTSSKNEINWYRLPLQNILERGTESLQTTSSKKNNGEGGAVLLVGIKTPHPGSRKGRPQGGIDDDRAPSI